MFRATMYAMAEATLGIRIRRARERLRWTQQQLADAVGVTARAIGDWERDVKVPRSSIGALEQVLGADLTDGGEVTDVYTHPDELRIWSWDDLPREKRREWIAELREARRRRDPA